MTRVDERFKTLAVVFLAAFIVLPSSGNQTTAFSTAAAGAASQAATPAQATAPAPREMTAADNCVLAVVPDPVDSDARWMFDSLIDAIYRAAAARDFSLVNYYLPDWDPTRGESAPPAGKEHETTPGWIAFTRSEDVFVQETLKVYLVYETPTAGIHEGAMRAALTAATSPAVCAPSLPIRVIGPTFSGSAAGMRRVLLDFRTAHPLLSAHIITGSATSLATKATLSDGDHLVFDSAVLSDDVVVTRLLEFVDGRYPWPKPDVALLVESTPYGSAVASLPSVANDQRYQLLRFPLHISRLRGVDPSARGITDAEGDQSRMPLMLGDRFQPTDRLPVMTAATTAPAVDLMLHSILERIRRTRVSAVGLFATDTRDKLFLAQEISRAIPGILLFTTEADILYTHPQYRTAVRGMLVAGTYPMVPSEWVRGTSTTMHAFPNSSALGTYNAMLALLHQQDNKPDLIEYASPASGTPRVWFSVTTADGLWPLQYQPAEQQHYSTLSDTGLGVRPTVHASAWTWTACLLVLALAIGHWAVQRFVLTPAPPVTLGSVTWDPPDDTRHLTYLRVSLAALIVISVVFLGMWLSALDGGEAWLGIGVQLLAIGFAVAAIPWRRSTESWPTMPAERAIWATGLLLGVGVVVLGGLYIWNIAAWPGDVRRLFFDRAAHPSSGASPVFAFAAIVLPVYLWGIVHAVGTNKCPDDVLFTVVRANGAGEDAEKWVKAFSTAAIRPLQAAHPAAIALVIVGVAAALAAMGLQAMAAAEPPEFTWAALVAWLLVQLLLSLSFLQTFAVWGRFKQLLRGLAAHPLVDAYERVPSQMLGNRLSPRRPTTRDLASLVHARTELASPLAPLKADVPDTRAGALAAMRKLSERAINLDRDLVAHRAGWTKSPTFCALVADVADLRVALTPWWSHQLSPDDAPLKAWCQRAEELLGMFVVLFVRETLARVSSALLFMLIAVLLLVQAQSVFTFHPRQVLLALTWCYAAATIAAALVVFVTIERDLVLARLASTPAGRVLWDRVFVSKLLIYALIPLATLFAAQFPQIGQIIQQGLASMQGLP